MKGFVIGTIVTAIAFAAVVKFVPHITFDGQVTTLIALSLIAGVVNGLIKPIVRLLALPIRMMTLGLIGFVINAGLLLFIAWIAGKLEIKFAIAGFPPDFTIDAVVWAVVASIVLSVTSTAVGLLVHD